MTGHVLFDRSLGCVPVELHLSTEEGLGIQEPALGRHDDPPGVVGDADLHPGEPRSEAQVVEPSTDSESPAGDDSPAADH